MGIINAPITTQEINQVLGDFNIGFDVSSGAAGLVQGHQLRGEWTQQSVSSVGTVDPTMGMKRIESIVLAFRILRSIRFTQPIPRFGMTSPYEWLRDVCQQGVSFLILGDPKFTNNGIILGAAALGGTTASVSVTSMVEKPFANRLFLSSTFLHEALHTGPGGSRDHDCSSGSDNFYSNGPYVFSYYFFKSLYEANADPQGWAVSDQSDLRAFVNNVIKLLWNYSLCHDYTGQLSVNRPAGDALSSSSGSTSPVLAPAPQVLSANTLTPDQIRHLLRPDVDIHDVATQQALSGALGLPWDVIWTYKYNP